MINNNTSRSPSPSSQMLYESGLSSDFSLDSASSDAQNAETVDRGEVAWSQFQSGKNKTTNQLFIAAEAGVFKARLGMMHELCRPSTPSTPPNENNFLNALLWGKKAIGSFQAMSKTVHILNISEQNNKPDRMSLKSTFIENLKVADAQVETNHQLGARFCTFNSALPGEEIQSKTTALREKILSGISKKSDLDPIFNEMQYLSNTCIAQQQFDNAVKIYEQLLPLLPSVTPPWQTSTS